MHLTQFLKQTNKLFLPLPLPTSLKESLKRDLNSQEMWQNARPGPEQETEWDQAHRDQYAVNV